MKFAREIVEPRFQPRAALAGKDAKPLAAEILAMSEDEFRGAFKGSAMKRAKWRAPKRNAGARCWQTLTTRPQNITRSAAHRMPCASALWGCRIGHARVRTCSRRTVLPTHSNVSSNSSSAGFAKISSRRS